MIAIDIYHSNEYLYNDTLHIDSQIVFVNSTGVLEYFELNEKDTDE